MAVGSLIVATPGESGQGAFPPGKAVQRPPAGRVPACGWGSSPTITKGSAGFPCRGLGAVPQLSPLSHKGIQGSPCRGLGDWSPTLSLPTSKGVQGAPCRG